MKRLQQIILKRVPDSLQRQIKLLSVILLLALTGAYIVNIYYIASSNAQNIKVLNRNKMEQIKNEMEVYSENISHVASALMYSSPAYEYFTMDEVKRVVSRNELTSVFLNATMMEEDIKHICLYDGKKNMIAGSEIFLSEGKSNFSEQKGGHLEFGSLFVSDYNGLSYYTISFPVFDLSDKTYGIQIGTTLFVMSTSGLEDMIQDTKVTEHSSMYLLDNEGNIMASYGQIQQDNLNEILEQKMNRYYVEERAIDAAGWKLVSVIPQKEILFGTPGLYVNITLSYLFVVMILTALFLLFRRWVISPLEHMDGFIKNILSEPDASMETKRKDEIGSVIRSLNQMLDEKEILENNIQQSQKKMYEMELSKKKIQILAYRNQINPHFLYNTFDCIRAMALCYDAEDIAEITMSLSEVFRYAVKGENIVRVEEELAYVREYAKIVGYRFMGNIRIHIETEEAVRQKKMIKLLLQPLVENAVFHGVEKNLDGGDIFVNVQMTDKGLIQFCVEDNGCGMTEERKKEILDMLEQEEKEENVKGIGLLNIYKRLRLFYGMDADFSIESSQGKGTKVLIAVPEQIQGEENV